MRKMMLLALGFIVPWVQAAPTLINGAGATFPYPLYSRWFHEYNQKHPSVQINYQSIGSGGGIRQFTDGTVDFGASDSPLNEEQIAKLKAPAVHVPTVLGAVVVAYNLPHKDLRLTGEILSDIYLGKIQKWNDPKILALNPGNQLTGDIVVVHRSDGSGTTAIFTDYLSKISGEWSKKVGKGTSVPFPVGLGGKGNEGVAGILNNTPGSLGYVELIYAESNKKLEVASLKNAAGEFIRPSVKGVTLAAAEAKIPDDYRTSITNSTGKGSYPISAFTYLIVPKSLPANPKGEELKKFLHWAVMQGQSYAAELQYAPLPKTVAKRVEKTIDSLELKKVN